MKFGIWDHMSKREDCDLTQQYEERLQLIEQGDKAGLHAYFVAEHHHTNLCMAPSQNVFLAAAAQRTKNIRLGAAIYITPMYHPVRLLEEIIMLDRLSNGRIEIGLSAGAAGGGEVVVWGLDPAENREKFLETLDIIIQGLTGEFVDHHGKFYDFKHLWMALKPQQKPYPPIWYGGSPAKAGELGLKCFATHRPLGELKEYRQAYFDAWKEAQHNPASYVLKGQAPEFTTHHHIFIDDTDKAAIERGRAAYAALGPKWNRPLPPGVAPYVPRLDRSKANPRDLPWLEDFDLAVSLEKVLCGSPSTIRDYMRKFSALYPDDQFLTAFQFGDLTHAEASHSMKLFTDEVIPATLVPAE